MGIQTKNTICPLSTDISKCRFHAAGFDSPAYTNLFEFQIRRNFWFFSTYIFFNVSSASLYFVMGQGFLLLFCFAFFLLVVIISRQCDNKVFLTILHCDHFSVYMLLPTPTSLLFLFSSTSALFLSWIPRSGYTAISSIPRLRKTTLPYCAVVVQHHGQCLMPQRRTLLVMEENRFFYFYRSSCSESTSFLYSFIFRRGVKTSTISRLKLPVKLTVST